MHSDLSIVQTKPMGSVTEQTRPGRRRRIPRVSGKWAGACAAIGVALSAGGVTISVVSATSFAEWLGFGVFFLGVWAIAAPTTLWLMARYGISDSLERSREWMDSAPRLSVRRRRS
jgi:hypothetical protein